MPRKNRIDDLYQMPRAAVICEICSREINSGDGEDHHLIPIHKGGKKGPLVHIHRFCHSKIHATFTNHELAKVYNNPEAIRSNPVMAEFIKWVSGKPSEFYMKNDATRSIKKKRK